jgi:hypothetical protein
MTSEMIEKFVEGKGRQDSAIQIHFKERSTITGVFIRTADYGELKMKNLWRIVSHGKIEEWNKTKNIDLARIFNGLSFTRLTDEQ